RVDGVLADITESKQAQEKLGQAAAEIHDLYNHAPCGYHSLDADGRFLAINDTELAWLGYTRAEVVGKMRFVDLLTPAGRQTFADNFPPFLERGWVRDLEYDLVRKDGSTPPVLLSATAVRDGAGHFVRSRTTFIDISARRRIEADLRIAKE